MSEVEELQERIKSLENRLADTKDELAQLSPVAAVVKVVFDQWREIGELYKERVKLLEDNACDCRFVTVQKSPSTSVAIQCHRCGREWTQ